MLSAADGVRCQVWAGIRGAGRARPEEVAAARAYGAEILTAKELHEKGVEGVLGRVPEGAACLLTIDCDGLDPSIIPAVNAPLPGGLSFRQVVDLIHGRAAKADIRGFDLVEFCPAKDMHGLGALTAVSIVINAIGALVRMRKTQRPGSQASLEAGRGNCLKHCEDESKDP